ncbi:MAG: HEAT repeat domain-containing protein [Methanomicrobiales archaeon]
MSINFEKVLWPGDAQVQRVLRSENTTGLISLLGYPDQDIQRKSSDRLADIGEPAVPLLVKSLKHRKMIVRLGAVEALGRIKSPQAVLPLIELLRNDKSNEVRWASVYSLASIGEDSAILPIVIALRDPDKYVRYGAATALDTFGWEPPETPMLAYYYIARQEWDKIPPLGEQANAPLLWALKDQDPRVRAATVDSLGELHTPASRGACSIALRDPDPLVRKHAALAFPKCGIPLTILPMGLSRRPRTKPSPYIAALLNLMFLGIGYNYLGYWFGFLLFQVFITINLMTIAVTGSHLPLLVIPLISVPYSILFAIHAWYLGNKIPDL